MTAKGKALAITKQGEKNYNPHEIGLSECQTVNGEPAYPGLVNKYPEASNEYIANHAQPFTYSEEKVPTFLKQAHCPPFSNQDLDAFQKISDYVDGSQNNDQQEIFMRNK